MVLGRSQVLYFYKQKKDCCILQGLHLLSIKSNREYGIFMIQIVNHLKHACMHLDYFI